MKVFFCLGLFILSYVSILAQTPKTVPLSSYIQKEGYVPLKDKVHLPANMLPFYKAIMHGLTKSPWAKNCYAKKNSIDDNDKFFAVTLYPIEGIKLLKDTRDKQHRLNYEQKLKDTGKPHVKAIDDFGGSVGEVRLSLNKVTNAITLYQSQ